MLGALLSRWVQPLPSRGYDRLFSSDAPKAASAAVLHALYHQHDDAYPDEALPPQHKHYRTLVAQIVANDFGQVSRADTLRRVRAAYASCFDQSDAFRSALKQWRREPAFRASLIQARERVIAELTPNAAAEAKRRRHYSRWSECLATPIDIGGDTLLDLIKQMGPDDWHEIALKWNWDHGVAELDWMTSQRACDRATAVYVLCAGRPGDVASGKQRPADHAGFVRDLAARIEGGFYPRAELSLGLAMRLAASFGAQLDAARATNQSPWRLPQDLLTHEGVRVHQPKYAVNNGIAHYDYEYWRSHVAP